MFPPSPYRVAVAPLTLGLLVSLHLFHSPDMVLDVPLGRLGVGLAVEASLAGVVH